MTEYIQAITTTEIKEDAQKIVSTVLEKKLAACAQIIGPITSTYWWKGKIETSEEWLCVMKTKANLYEELEKAIRQVHPYEVPEILATPVVAGYKSYLDWLNEQVDVKQR